MKKLPLITLFIAAATVFHTVLPASSDIPQKDITITSTTRIVKYTGSYNGKLISIEATFTKTSSQLINKPPHKYTQDTWSLSKLTGSDTQDLNGLLQRFYTMNQQYFEHYRFRPQPDLPKS